MTKRKLTHRQQARIHKRHREHLDNMDEPQKGDNTSLTGPKLHGLVICRYAKHAEVEDEEKARIRCQIRSNIGSLVAGDKVIWQRTKESQTGVIIAKLERTSVLGRGDKQGEIRPVAANVNQMIIVTAAKPELSTLLLDSYLVAAETLNINPIIVFNKMDLLPKPKVLMDYQAIGYTLICTSTKSLAGLNTLSHQLQNQISVFVGQSGVGKSSIISILDPNAHAKTNAISKQSELGKHTTSNSTLYHLSQGGSIIDSPGIREFGLWHMDKQTLIEGFVEFRPYIGQCKFKNCSHQHEIQCAFKDALSEGLISSHRFNSLKQLLTKL